MSNYALMTLVYLSQMHDLQTKKSGNLENAKVCSKLSLNTSVKHFTSVGADDGIEQGNRAIIVERIKGIATSNQTFKEFFLTASEMRRIVTSFCETSVLKKIKEGRGTSIINYLVQNKEEL